jgi:hypothetical protein
MIPLLPLVPPVVSLFLGIIFLTTSGSSPIKKATVVIVFLLAVLLQFSSPYRLAGLLLQTALAIGLAVWRKTSA